ncbi:MAG: L-2-amino-thiazoline-4-carboxylic acid hydrolase [Deltaproteobacteria bacterium]|nr:L-2-amino-thiazoline-4-carboxylic acid hydrolase [Candidatus Zymogenaceae bacterium]
MKTNENSSYYLDRMEAYWKKYRRMLKSSYRVLPRYVDASEIETIAEETKAEFEMLLGQLPYIGDKNMLTWNLVGTAMGLAFFRALERRGLTVETIGKVINEIYIDVFTSMPWFVKRFLRWYIFSRYRQKKLRAFAVESKLKEYPGNWVMEYVAGDGVNFDFGYNCTQCAILMFFQKMGAEKYVPYLCATDYGASRGVGTGLQRTMTLALGGECCDFRFKKNGPVRSGLPLDDLPEYRNRKS